MGGEFEPGSTEVLGVKSEFRRTKGHLEKISCWKITKFRRLPGSPSGMVRKSLAENDVARRRSTVGVSGRHTLPTKCTPVME